MSGPQDSETVATAKDLTEALGRMAGEVNQLRTYGKRNRMWVVFDIAVTVVLAVVTFVAVHASDSAHTATAAAVAARAAAGVAQQDNAKLCESSNLARAQQVGLWSYLFSLAGPPRTAQGAKLTAEFVRHLHVVFAPRNCSHPNGNTP